jgi:DNA (cytosine-5)-methyltransferase 1
MLPQKTLEFVTQSNPRHLRFFDCCSGIGAGRQGLENLGYSSVGFSEINQKSVKTFNQMHGNTDSNYGDLTKITPSSLPDFDVLIAGFPCQTFSIAGRRAGFEDDRGQIIFYLAEILKVKQPKYFIFENVKGLVNLDGGKTLSSILELLKSTGYNVFYKVLNSADFGVPQLRERVYFVGTKERYFEFPEAQPQNYKIEDFLCDGVDYIPNATFEKYLANKYNTNFDITKVLDLDYQVLDTRQSDARVYDKKAPTLRTGRHGILYSKGGKLKKLSALEALLLQGFSKEKAQKALEINSETELLSQAGNAMTVSVIEAIAREMIQ